MDAVPLEMDDIFEERPEEGEEDQLPQMLPDLPEGLESEIQGTQNDDETENKEVLAKLKGMKGASKNTVKRPMPKLDSIRLTGERGIPILPRIFKDVKLKGKGHEVDDLRVVMRYLEHWAHRLFPKMPFDEVLERIERLGTKRDVQTCIKKMRLDMPVLGSDTVTRGEDEDGEQGQDGQDGQQAEEQQPQSAEDLFDSLLRAEREMEAERDDEDRGSSQQQSQGDGGGDGQTAGVAPAACQSSQGLSAEVQERIERNRRLAMEKRAKKLGGPIPSSSQQASTSCQPPTSSVCQVASDGPSSGQSDQTAEAVNSAQPQVNHEASNQPSSQVADHLNSQALMPELS